MGTTYEMRDALQEVESWRDEFECRTTNADELAAAVSDTETHSVWEPDFPSQTFRVIPIESPIETEVTAKKWGLDYARTMENATEGTRLILEHGKEHHNVSAISRGTLYETAKLSGSALGRMHQIPLSECLNHGFRVARGTSLVLVRHDKVMAMHSGSGYCIMPVSDLLEISKEALERRFKIAEFSYGFHSNAYTRALWDLPYAQNELLDMYQKTMTHAISRSHAINFMPGVRLDTSDTARRAATLTPVFRMQNGAELSFGGEISVKHEKSAKELYGIDLFRMEADTLFAKFNETMEVIQKLAEAEIRNPVNTCVGLFNWINRGTSIIPRKYADAAREDVERFTVSCPIMSAHDIYLSMTECLSAARAAGASHFAMTAMEEALNRILTLDWAEFDVSGVVAWGEKRN